MATVIQRPLGPLSSSAVNSSPKDLFRGLRYQAWWGWVARYHGQDFCIDCWQNISSERIKPKYFAVFDGEDLLRFSMVSKRLWWLSNIVMRVCMTLFMSKLKIFSMSWILIGAGVRGRSTSTNLRWEIVCEFVGCITDIVWGSPQNLCISLPNQASSGVTRIFVEWETMTEWCTRVHTMRVLLKLYDIGAHGRVWRKNSFIWINMGKVSVLWGFWWHCTKLASTLEILYLD